MIKKVIRLVKPGVFLPCFAEENTDNNSLVVRPEVLSICAADQRYFSGSRSKDVLARKLPMALIHEAVGRIVFDPEKKIEVGTYCVLLPGGDDKNIPNANYIPDAPFRSSNDDGFCQEVLVMDRGAVLPINEGFSDIYVFTEPMSVCVQGLRQIGKRISLENRTLTVGIWGDGSLGYMMALTIKKMYPKFRIIVYGKHDDKLTLFSFADEIRNIADTFDKNLLDIAIECVGGQGAQSAITQAINKLHFCGVLLLTGVSENQPSIPTRAILEKGLTLIGTSRSTKFDFEVAMSLINDSSVKEYLQYIVSARIDFENSTELKKCFESDISNSFKTILRPNI